MDKKFLRVRSAKDMALSGVLVAAGIVCLVIPTPATVNILGAFVTFIGLVLAFVLRTGRKDADTGIRYRKVTKFFSSDMKPEIIQALENGASGFDWSQRESDEGLKVDIFYNRQKDKAFVQCSQYVPYEYVPCSGWYEMSVSRTGNLTSEEDA